MQKIKNVNKDLKKELKIHILMFYRIFNFRNNTIKFSSLFKIKFYMHFAGKMNQSLFVQ